MQPGMTPVLRSSEPARGPLERVQFELKTQLGTKRYALFCAGRVQLQIDDDCLRVLVHSPFVLSVTQQQFRPALLASARTVLGPSARVEFAVDEQLSRRTAEAAGLTDLPVPTGERTGAATRQPGEPTASDEGASGPARSTAVRPPVATRLQPPDQATRQVVRDPAALGRSRKLASLDDFVCGESTRTALAAAQLAGRQTTAAAAPLYLYGPVGTGKTHLLEGIARSLRQAEPQANVVLISAEAFANSFSQALTDKSLPGFRQRFRGADALLVDDIDFFESKRVFQEEFLHTFSELASHGRLIVLTGDRHPRLLTKLCDELQSRVVSGVLSRLDLPDLEVRRAILQGQAERMSLPVSPEAIDHIARKFTTSVRELEGALYCLQAHQPVPQQRITLAQTRKVLADLEQDCHRTIRLADIERVICQAFGLRAAELKSDSRSRTVAQPRMLAMFLARKLTTSAYAEIGQHFGGRNHSTVMSAERKVQQWVETQGEVSVSRQNWAVPELLANLEQQLLAG